MDQHSKLNRIASNLENNQWGRIKAFLLSFFFLHFFKNQKSFFMKQISSINAEARLASIMKGMINPLQLY